MPNTKDNKELMSQIIKMSDLLDYQAGSVVSRTIIKKPTGTVTLFAFDKGEGLSEHTAPFDALVYILDGRADIMISGKPYHLKAGEMIIMPAGATHSLKSPQRFKMALIMIRS
jgi:quercetin dioxygenase-like cupin family protein